MPAQTKPVDKPTRRGRILVADDNHVNRVVAQQVLQHAGYSCDVVDDGKQALEAVRNGQIDLVLMDCQMPVMDGFAATAAIHAIANDGVIPRSPKIVAFTANAVTSDRQTCIEAGMDEYLNKPINPQQITETLSRLIPETPEDYAEADGAQAEAAPAEEPDRPTAIDTDVLMQQCMNMADLAQQILGIFEQSCNDDLEQLRAAANSADANQVATFAHKIKGAAAQVGATPLRELAGELEKAGQDGATDKIQTLHEQVQAEARRCINSAPSVIEGLK